MNLTLSLIEISVYAEIMKALIVATMIVAIIIVTIILVTIMWIITMITERVSSYHSNVVDNIKMVEIAMVIGELITISELFWKKMFETCNKAREKACDNLFKEIVKLLTNKIKMKVEKFLQ